VAAAGLVCRASAGLAHTKAAAQAAFRTVCDWRHVNSLEG
jgi:hypothetical protein